MRVDPGVTAIVISDILTGDKNDLSSKEVKNSKKTTKNKKFGLPGNMDIETELILKKILDEAGVPFDELSSLDLKTFDYDTPDLWPQQLKLNYEKILQPKSKKLTKARVIAHLKADILERYCHTYLSRAEIYLQGTKNYEQLTRTIDLLKIQLQEIRQLKSRQVMGKIPISNTHFLGALGELVGYVEYVEILHQELSGELNPLVVPEGSAINEYIIQLIRNCTTYSPTINGFDHIIAIPNSSISGKKEDGTWLVAILECKFKTYITSTTRGIEGSGTYMNNLDFIIKIQDMQSRFNILTNLLKIKTITDAKSLLHTFEVQYKRELTFARLQSDILRNPFLSISETEDGLSFSRISNSELLDIMAHPEKYADQTFWPNIHDDMGEIDVGLVTNFLPNRADSGMQNRILHSPDGQPVIYTSGQDTYQIPIKAQTRKFHVFMDEQGKLGSLATPHSCGVTLNIVEYDMSRELWQSLVDDGTIVQQTGVIYLPKSSGYRGRLQDLFQEMLDYDESSDQYRLVVADGRYLYLGYPGDTLVTAGDHLLRLLSGNEPQLNLDHFRKITTILSTGPGTSFQNNRHSHAYHNNSLLLIRENLPFTFARSTSELLDFDAYRVFIIEELIDRIQQMQKDGELGREEANLLVERLSDVFASSEIVENLRAMLRDDLTRKLENLMEIIEEHYDRPAYGQTTSRFVKGLGENPPEGSYVIKDTETRYNNLGHYPAPIIFDLDKNDYYKRQTLDFDNKIYKYTKIKFFLSTDQGTRIINPEIFINFKDIKDKLATSQSKLQHIKSFLEFDEFIKSIPQNDARQLLNKISQFSGKQFKMDAPQTKGRVIYLVDAFLQSKSLLKQFENTQEEEFIDSLTNLKLNTWNSLKLRLFEYEFNKIINRSHKTGSKVSDQISKLLCEILANAPRCKNSFSKVSKASFLYQVILLSRVVKVSDFRSKFMTGNTMIKEIIQATIRGEKNTLITSIPSNYHGGVIWRRLLSSREHESYVEAFIKIITFRKSIFNDLDQLIQHDKFLEKTLRAFQNTSINSLSEIFSLYFKKIIDDLKNNLQDGRLNGFYFGPTTASLRQLRNQYYETVEDYLDEIVNRLDSIHNSKFADRVYVNFNGVLLTLMDSV